MFTKMNQYSWIKLKLHKDVLWVVRSIWNMRPWRSTILQPTWSVPAFSNSRGKINDMMHVGWLTIPNQYIDIILILLHVHRQWVVHQLAAEAEVSHITTAAHPERHPWMRSTVTWQKSYALSKQEETALLLAC